ncbi:MAG TPA: amino acid ABC transporter substrate-binding protein [Acidimicrobiia bacterium]|nr:amino acid ABC transporter substrate-binding protein [Acidimicrobiia bacterium]
MQRKLLALLAVLAMAAAACTTGDPSADTVPVTDTDGTTAETTPPDTGDTGTTDTTGPAVLPQDEGGVLAAVQDRGTVRCGVNDVLPGFGVVDENGEYSGFDIDFCRAVAAGVLGDPEAVEFVPLTADARFTALQGGEIDVLIRNTTWTATRDGQEGATFLKTTFYDGQALMVPASTGFTELEDLADATICVLQGTTTELNLTAVFNARGIPFNPSTHSDNETLQPAYESGQCEAWTSDFSQLSAFKHAIEEAGGEEQHIMEEIISKEPLGPAVPDGDSAWAQAVEWSVLAPIQAWEFGLTSETIGSYDGDDPNIMNFVGTDGFDPGLGLAPDFNVTIVEAVGNYQEIFERHLVPIGLVLEGTLNDLWTNGGLHYPPPYR